MASSEVDIGKREVAEAFVRHCQTNVNGPAKGASRMRSRLSRRELTPLGQDGRAVLFEDIAAVEVAVVVEVVVDGCVSGGKLMERLHVPELRHRSFSSSERLVGILSPVVEPATALLTLHNPNNL